MKKGKKNRCNRRTPGSGCNRLAWNINFKKGKQKRPKWKSICIDKAIDNDEAQD